MQTERGRIGLGIGVVVVGAALVLALGAMTTVNRLPALVVVVVLTTVALAAIVLRGQTAARVASGVCQVLLVLSVGGAAIEGYRVADVVGGGASRFEYHGKIDSTELYRSGDSQQLAIRRNVSYPTAVTGTESVPNPKGKQKLLYAVQELLPILLAIAVLALLAPLLRAAARGRPFGRSVTRRVTIMGWVLLIGLPALGAIRFLLAYSISELYYDGALVREPTAFTTTSILPGLLVLGLAVVFRRGAEMQELEEHTV